MEDGVTLCFCSQKKLIRCRGQTAVSRVVSLGAEHQNLSRSRLEITELSIEVPIKLVIPGSRLVGKGRGFTRMLS